MDPKTKDAKIKEATKGGCGLLILIALAVFLYSALFGGEKQLTPEEARVKKIEVQFDPWDGSHLKLTEKIKDAMNDPGSYENINTSYSDQKDFLIISQTYTGKNAFGGRVKGFVKAKVDNEGNVLSILEER